jgi:hypothetical protein
MQEEDFQREISRYSLLEPIIVKLRDSDSEETKSRDKEDRGICIAFTVRMQINN